MRKVLVIVACGLAATIVALLVVPRIVESQMNRVIHPPPYFASTAHAPC
jgi:hypothetical protein